MVQVRNLRTGRYIKIDPRGGIVAHRKSPGPHKGIPIAKMEVKGMKSHVLCQMPRAQLRRIEKEQEAFLGFTGRCGFDYVKDFDDGSSTTVVVIVAPESDVVWSRGVAIKAMGDPVHRRVGRIIARGRAIRALNHRSTSGMHWEIVANLAILWWRDTFGTFKAIGDSDPMELTEEEKGIWGTSSHFECKSGRAVTKHLNKRQRCPSCDAIPQLPCDCDY
jgi:hypothetical protein